MKRSVLAFVFLLGMIGGVVLEHVVGHFMPPRPPNPVEIEGHLTRDLDLDEAQRAKIHQILLDADSSIRALHEKTRADFDAQLTSDQELIGALLRPDQKQKFDALKARWDKHRKMDMDMPPPPFQRP